MRPLARRMMVSLGRPDCDCLDLGPFLARGFETGRVPVCRVHGESDLMRAAKADGAAQVARVVADASRLSLNADPAAFPSLAGMTVKGAREWVGKGA